MVGEGFQWFDLVVLGGWVEVRIVSDRTVCTLTRTTRPDVIGVIDERSFRFEQLYEVTYCAHLLKTVRADTHVVDHLLTAPQKM